MSKKKKKEKYRRMVEKSQQQDNIVRDNKFDVNLGIGNFPVKRDKINQLYTWPGMEKVVDL